MNKQHPNVISSSVFFQCRRWTVAAYALLYSHAVEDGPLLPHVCVFICSAHQCELFDMLRLSINRIFETIRNFAI